MPPKGRKAAPKSKAKAASATSSMSGRGSREEER